MAYTSRNIGDRLEIIRGVVIVGTVKQGEGGWVGQHSCRPGRDGYFARECDAIEYVIGVDLIIDMSFEGTVEVAA